MLKEQHGCTVKQTEGGVLHIYISRTQVEEVFSVSKSWKLPGGVTDLPGT